MPEEIREETISLLVRVNRGRRNRYAFLDGLSRAVGFSVGPDKLLDLNATDQVRADLSTGYALALSARVPAKRIFFNRDESLTALQIPELLAKSLPEENALLWLKQSSDCGAIFLTAEQVLRACEMILLFDGDTVSLLSEDHTQGFIFDKNDDDATETFEISIWGSRWLAAATACGIG
jgi:hypothetical protein